MAQCRGCSCRMPAVRRARLNRGKAADQSLVRAGDQSLDDALATARVVTAAYQVGGMLEMLDMSVAHSNTRIQFGTPIGRFQRVQDHIIRLLNAMDAARWATYEAAWAIDSGRNGVARSYLAGSTASDGYSAIATAQKERPDLIILDLGLPVGDGFVVLERLQTSNPLSSIPVIVLTARDPQNNEDRVMKAGAAAFFQKPVDNDELLNVIRVSLPRPESARAPWPS